VSEKVNGREITRPYSIASPPGGNQFALCLNRVPDRLLSSYLFELKPGEEIDMQEPFGYFTLRHPGRQAVFVATGTGIAPFRSMLLHYVPRTEPHITLLFGARSEQGLLYQEEFEQLASEHPTFRFLPTISRPGASWKGRTGRVQEHLDEALAFHMPGNASDLDVYVCGLREMVDNVREALKQRGLDRKQIIYEKYD
jgi:CDP-4-dehydro-6-deoxyglucose reductase